MAMHVSEYANSQTPRAEARVGVEKVTLAVQIAPVTRSKRAGVAE